MPESFLTAALSHTGPRFFSLNWPCAPENLPYLTWRILHDHEKGGGANAKFTTCRFEWTKQRGGGEWLKKILVFSWVYVHLLKKQKYIFHSFCSERLISYVVHYWSQPSWFDVCFAIWLRIKVQNSFHGRVLFLCHFCVKMLIVRTIRNVY